LHINEGGLGWTKDENAGVKVGRESGLGSVDENILTCTEFPVEVE